MKAIAHSSHRAWKALVNFASVLYQHARVLSLIALIVAVAHALLRLVLMYSTGHLLGAIISLQETTSAHDQLLWPLVLFGVSVVGNGLLGCVVAPLADGIKHRVTRGTLTSLAAACTDPPTISHMEDSSTATRLKEFAAAFREWSFLLGVEASWSVLTARLSAIGAALIVGNWRWWAPLLLLPAWIALSRGFSRWSKGLFDEPDDNTFARLRRAEYYRNSLVSSSFAKEVRLFGLRDLFHSRFDELWQSGIGTVWRLRRAAMNRVLLGIAAVGVINSSVLAMLAVEAWHGALAPDSAVTVLLGVLAMAGFGVQGDQEVWARHARYTLLDFSSLQRQLSTPAVRNRQRLPRVNSCSGMAVAFENVSFTYPNACTSVLKNLSFTIPRGQSIGLVGVNGAGKSTLIKLLCGLYEDYSGSIRLDGVPRAQGEVIRIAALFQDFIRFPLTLRENVAAGVPEADLHAVDLALRDAGGWHLVRNLPRGVETILSSAYSGGQDLSGGEWQRVALARALLAKEMGARLMILDEPTAAMDAEGEARLFARFLELTRDTTTILVTHRLSSVRHADRIVVLDNGRIAEDGDHETLLAQGGRYARMFRLQAARLTNSPPSQP